MKIHLISDTHQEMGELSISNTVGAEVLIMSGDNFLAYTFHDWTPEDCAPPDWDVVWKPSKNQQLAIRFRTFLHHVSQEYDNVVVVSGNHEFYHGKFPDAHAWMREEISRYPNIHYLEKSSVKIGDYTFLGGTLWSDYNRADPNTMHIIEGMMNDYRVIRNSKEKYRKFLPKDALGEHRKTVDFIRDTVDADPTQNYIVVGHHLPSLQSIHPQYKTDFYMNGGYYSDLFDFIHDRPQIKLWTAGHTHNAHGYWIGETFVACNPRGYVGHEPQAIGYEPALIDLNNMPEKFDDVRWGREW